MRLHWISDRIVDFWAGHFLFANSTFEMPWDFDAAGRFCSSLLLSASARLFWTVFFAPCSILSLFVRRAPNLFHFQWFLPFLFRKCYLWAWLICVSTPTHTKISIAWPEPFFMMSSWKCVAHFSFLNLIARCCCLSLFFASLYLRSLFIWTNVCVFLVDRFVFAYARALPWICEHFQRAPFFFCCGSHRLSNWRSACTMQSLTFDSERCSSWKVVDVRKRTPLAVQMR